MRKLITLFLSCFTLISHAQDSLPHWWVGVNLGSQVTQLNFAASNGSSVEYSPQLNFTQGANLAFINHGFILDFNLDYYRVSGISTNTVVNTSISLGYFQPSVNVAYALKIGSFPLRPRLGAGIGYALMIDGTQQTQSNIADLIANEALTGSDLGANLNIGVIVFSRANIAMSCLYNYRIGLSNIENATTNQTTKTTLHGLLLKVQLGL